MEKRRQGDTDEQILTSQCIEIWKKELLECAQTLRYYDFMKYQNKFLLLPINQFFTFPSRNQLQFLLRLKIKLPIKPRLFTIWEGKKFVLTLLIFQQFCLSANIYETVKQIKLME